MSYLIDSIDAGKPSQVTLSRFGALSWEGQWTANTDSVENRSPLKTLRGSTRSGIDEIQTCEETNQAHFRIVWRQLSFEVDTKSYDKIITSTFNKLSSVLRRSSDDSSKKPQQEQQSQGTKRMIFENLNGHIKSGEITAIIGPSGAGKTSLLNALCGQSENCRGSVQLIGGSQAKKMRSSIMPQRDYLIEKLTVCECLLYASKILNSDRSFDHATNIERVVKMLNLSACFDSSISRISGGEYKRVSIAQELLSQPDILILDEPTSGLDSLNCKNLIRSLSTLMKASQKGSLNPFAIVMTIHQPDIEIFNLFDHVYCMARGGKVIYDGQARDAFQVIKAHAQFETSNVPSELQLEMIAGDKGQQNLCAVNPANLLIEIASGEYGLEPIESLARLQRKQFETSSTELLSSERSSTRSDSMGDLGLESIHIGSDGNKLSLTCDDDTRMTSLGLGAPKLMRDKRLNPTRNAQKNSFFYLTNLLTRRAFVANIRDPMVTLTSLVWFLMIPIVMYIVYPLNIGKVLGCPLVVRDIETLSLASNQTLNIIADLQDELSVSNECQTMLFMVVYAYSMCSIIIAALTFPINMHVLLKEVRNGWYSLSSFVTAETIASLPFQVLFPTISIAMVYLLLDMPSSYLYWRVWAVIVIIALHSLVGQANGLIFGAFCMDSVQASVFLGLASSFPQVLFSGFTARIKKMPVWLGSFSYFSPFRYTLQMITMIRFGFGLCPCDHSTTEYMRERQSEFTDIPAQMKPVFNYYLSNLAPNSSSESNPTNDSAQQQELIPGIYYGLTLNSSERANIISRLDSGGIDIFHQMAEQLTRSFSFGQSIEDCDSLRSQLLKSFDIPHEHEMPVMLACLFCLLVGFRTVLYFVIKFRISSQI